MKLLPRRGLLAVLVALLATFAGVALVAPAGRRAGGSATEPAVRVHVPAAAVRAGRPGSGDRAGRWAETFALAASSIFAIALVAAGRAYASGRIGRGFGRGLRPTSRGPPLHLAG
jgi:hypothetical protein